MDLDTFRMLLFPAGQQVLQAAEALAPREADFLAHFTVLSRGYPAELSRAALEVAILRREAGDKFPFARQLYLTRPALEQATAYAVSSYRAERFRPYQAILDLGCSIGGDTFSLAQVAFTAGVDLDPLRLAMARVNLQAFGLQDRAVMVHSDLLRPPFKLHPGLAIFFDPARRAQQKRIFSVHDYQPPLSAVKSWLASCPAVGVKISPGVRLAELNEYSAEVEFISLDGELKEAVLWFGPLQTVERRATLLPGRHTLAGLPDDRRDGEQLPLREPQTYLYEPDPAVLRAGLVGLLGMQLGAAQLDPDIAYLTAQQLTPTPFARAWMVEAWFPFSLKRLRSALRERRVGRVTVKKRGSPLEPERLIQDLRLSGDQERVVFLTHLRPGRNPRQAPRPVAILAYPGPGG